MGTRAVVAAVVALLLTGCVAHDVRPNEPGPDAGPAATVDSGRQAPSPARLLERAVARTFEEPQAVRIHYSSGGTVNAVWLPDHTWSLQGVYYPDGGQRRIQAQFRSVQKTTYLQDGVWTGERADCWKPMRPGELPFGVGAFRPSPTFSPVDVLQELEDPTPGEHGALAVELDPMTAVDLLPFRLMPEVGDAEVQQAAWSPEAPGVEASVAVSDQGVRSMTLLGEDILAAPGVRRPSGERRARELSELVVSYTYNPDIGLPIRKPPTDELLTPGARTCPASRR